MSDEDLKVDSSDVASDRGTDRSERSTESAERGEAHELSGGKRDRSREMLREELEKSFDQARGKGDRDERRDWEPVGRAARKAKEATAEKSKAAERDRDAADATPTTAAQGADASGGATLDTSSAPKSWRADERAHYNSLPPAIKNAVHRREQEMSAGVEQIKQKHAAEDAAWLPHESVLKSFGKSRAETVTQLMSWWNALAANPHEAFPALLQSFKLTPEQIFGSGQQQQQQQQQQQAAMANLSPVEQAMVPYLQHFQQEIGGLKQTFQQQRDQEGAARANAAIEEFKINRPHFEAVRGKMAALIQSGAVPLTPSGAVDLARAYDEAVWSSPETRRSLRLAERPVPCPFARLTYREPRATVMTSGFFPSFVGVCAWDAIRSGRVSSSGNLPTIYSNLRRSPRRSPTSLRIPCASAKSKAYAASKARAASKASAASTATATRAASTAAAASTSSTATAAAAAATAATSDELYAGS
jgi:hypothetical protein